MADIEPIFYYGKALFYPFIQLNDMKWLKTSALYYNHLKRIVPSQIKPVDNLEVSKLINAGFLSNLEVKQQVIERTAHEFSVFLETKLTDKVFREQLKRELGMLVPSGQTFRISCHKVAADLQRMLFELNLADKDRSVQGGEWLNFEPVTGAVYMTYLANDLSRENNMPVISSHSTFQKLIHTVQIENQFGQRDMGEALASIIIETAVPQNAEALTIEQIISFRKSFADERRRFYNEICKLVKDLEKVDGKEHLAEILCARQHDIHDAVDALRKSLKGNKIAGATALLSLSVPAIVTGSGTLIVATGVTAIAIGRLLSFNSDITKTIKGSPFSYVLRLRKLKARSFASTLADGKAFFQL